MVTYKYNSADNHLDQRWVPRTLWQDRVSQKFKEVAPKVIEEDGKELWTCEGKVYGGRDGGTADGKANRQILEQFFGKSGARLPDGGLPPSDPALLLEHMDYGNVYAYVGFGPTRKWDIKDPELHHEVFRVYADWVMELNAHDPDRLIILPILPTFDPPSVPDELRRLAALGCKAAEFPVADGLHPLFHEAWEPAWQAFEDTGIVMCAHIGGRADNTYNATARGERIAMFSCTPFSLARPMADIVFCGALHRHPGMKVLFGECRAGWIPFLAQWMDRQALERPGLFNETDLDRMPTEYLRRQVIATFEEDYVAGQMLHFEDCILRDILVFGSDYPHPQGTWPDPSPIFHKMFEGLPPALRHTIVYQRMLDFFDLDGPAPDAVIPLSEIAADGAGKSRTHASFD